MRLQRSLLKRQGEEVTRDEDLFESKSCWVQGRRKEVSSAKRLNTIGATTQEFS
jgi:hypothetical protein